MNTVAADAPGRKYFALLPHIVLAYCRTPLRRLQPHLASLAPVERIKAIVLVPVIRAVGDAAKMCGYPAGWVWRLRNWRRPEIHWLPDLHLPV